MVKTLPPSVLGVEWPYPANEKQLQRVLKMGQVLTDWMGIDPSQSINRNLLTQQQVVVEPINNQLLTTTNILQHTQVSQAGFFQPFSLLLLESNTIGKQNLILRSHSISKVPFCPNIFRYCQILCWQKLELFKKLFVNIIASWLRSSDSAVQTDNITVEVFFLVGISLSTLARSLLLFSTS